MSRFEHFLITRFNVKEPAWKPVDKHGQPTLTDEWMEHRFELFEKYCVSSIRKQVSKNFTWLVLFDADTSQEWLNRLPRMCKILRVIEWRKELQDYLNTTNKRWIITTRLDNDDAIAPWVIDDVQKQFKEQELTFVDFPRGYRLKDGKLYEHNEPCNPFLSLIERLGEHPKTVLAYEHGIKIAQTHNVVLGNWSSSWIQVIHERNKVTDDVNKEVLESGWAQYV